MKERKMRELEGLSEEERKALRGSKFAPLPNPSSLPRTSQPRLAHPGGPLTTNKAAALSKFLERKLKDPNGLNSINPDLLELAVNNAKQSVTSSSTSGSGRTIRHVDSFDDSDDPREKLENTELKHNKKKKKKKNKKKQQQQQQRQQNGEKEKKNKKKKRKLVENAGCGIVKKSKKLKT